MVRLLAGPFRASALLRAAAASAALALSACVAVPQAPRQAAPLALSGPGAAPGTAPSSAAGRRVAILLPLTGTNAEIGQAMLKATQLALAGPDSPTLDQQDTGGTPEGAANAARTALAAGAGLILGPLTGPETGAVAGIAKAAGVPVLAFTSDEAQAQPGVWVMGLTPAQQVRRLVLAMQAENKSRITAVVPQNPFGEALASGLVATASAASLPAPRLVRSPGTFTGFNDALKDAAAYASRRGAQESQQRAARGRNDADGRREATEIGRQTIPPPPMDALLLGATGELLSQVVPLLAFYDIGPEQLRLLGPGTWARDAARLPALSGAWYAAPDPAARAGFDQAYAAKYGAAPNDFAAIAFDAAGVARNAVTAQGFAVQGLTRPEGFAGAMGLIALLPEGQVRRGLAIFEVDRGGAHIVQPAPQSLSAPGT